MKSIGVVEGFFGPAWPEEKRLSYAEFMSQYGGNFYIYAPKQDPYLRKAWREIWDEAYLQKLQGMKNHFKKFGIQFGVGFSPFGLGTTLTEEDKKHLENKLSILNRLGIDLLGLFFDDMPTNDHLAETQIEALAIIQKSFHQRIVFCPSYYTPDPILEKVFGKMPERYLEKIADGIPLNVSVAWTGPKVISPVIDREHLVGVTTLLKRKPFIWENLFANDGPKNCKFLKLKPFSGRSAEAFAETEAFGFNMMNQPELSKMTYLASKYVLEGEEAEISFEKAVRELSSAEFATFVLEHRLEFLEKGLDVLPEETKQNYIQQLSVMKDPGALEIKEWLQGKYVVGSECLTD